MWADAQRDGRPAEYRWRPVRKFHNSIHCTTPQSLADAAAGVPCNNAANIGEAKASTQSEFCTWQNSVRGQEPLKMYIQCTSPGDGQTSCKVWLASDERRRYSNEAKTLKPLKFAGVPQTRQSISAVSGPTFAIVGTLEKILLFNQFFPIVDTCLSCEDIAQQSCAMVRRWRLFASFLRPVFPASRMQHISDLHSKFTLE